jgi:hypothetical protein
VALGPKSKALPVARASRDAGENLQFSGDSARLYWSLGPELYERELKDAFAFLAGAPEKLPEPPASGRDISFRSKYAQPAGLVALVGGRVITMKGDEVLEDGSVLVEGNRIRAVGRARRSPSLAGRAHRRLRRPDADAGHRRRARTAAGRRGHHAAAQLDRLRQPGPSA